MYFAAVVLLNVDTHLAAQRIVADAFMALGHYYLKGIPQTRRLRRTRAARSKCSLTQHSISAKPTRNGSPSNPQQAERWFQFSRPRANAAVRQYVADART